MGTQENPLNEMVHISTQNIEMLKLMYKKIQNCRVFVDLEFFMASTALTQAAQL